MADVLIDGPPVRAVESATATEKELEAPTSVVHEYLAPTPGRHVPQMLLATAVVAILPLVVSLGLRASGLVSGWVSVGLAVVMSLAASSAGSAYWRKRSGNTEVLFGELLLWGWIRSRRQERELVNATQLLHLVGPAAASTVLQDELSVDEREHLLRQLAAALEGQDIYLNGHSHRVARHATMIARGMGLSNQEVARVRAAAAVHDVGKLRTPKAILNKPGRLTDAEFEVIKRHPVDGAKMVAVLGDPELTRIVRHHHERLDGAGYPDRLKGEDIPVGARIIAVADTFDAITSARPYREAAPHQKAIDILRKEAGTQLDPDAVRAFLAYYSGNRPTMVWAIVTSSLRRVVSWLTGDPAAAATLSASKVAAATAATAAIGAAAGVAPVPVVHHTARPPSAHTAAARPRINTIGSRRHGTPVALSVPAAYATVARAHAPVPTKARRGAAHVAAAARNGSRRSHATGQAHRSMARSGASSPASTSALTKSASSTGASPVSPSPASPSTPSTSPKSAANPSVSNAGATAPSQTTPSQTTPSQTTPPQTTPASRSQGSSANGNAYGHTKLLGNGHGQGQGQAKGRADTSATPTSAVQPTTPATVSAPSTAGGQSDAGGQGSSATEHGNGNAEGHGNGQGNGNGNSQGKGNSPGTPSASAVATSIVSNVAGSVAGNDNGKGHGQGQGQGQGG